MLRSLDAALVGRLRAYARDHDLSLPEAADRLLTAALDRLEDLSAAGHARAESLSAADRSAIARRAANARWHQP